WMCCMTITEVVLKKIADDRGQAMAELALAWVLRDERVTSALIGASSVKQLDENVKTIQKLLLTEDEKSRIESILRG
ncbi:MAG: aldo/keto reductase, partial [Spirochaetota bacterium]